jgi:hypothetical protein
VVANVLLSQSSQDFHNRYGEPDISDKCFGPISVVRKWRQSGITFEEVTSDYSFSWSNLTVPPRWRAGHRVVAGHKLVGHAEQVSQHIRIDAR